MKRAPSGLSIPSALYRYRSSSGRGDASDKAGIATRRKMLSAEPALHSEHATV